MTLVRFAAKLLPGDAMATVSLPFRTLAWEGGIDGRFLILDQRRLPREQKEI